MQAYDCGYDIDSQFEIGNISFAHYFDVAIESHCHKISC